MTDLHDLADRLESLAREVRMAIEQVEGDARLRRMRRSRPPDLEIDLDRADVIWRGRRVKGLTYAQMVIVETLSRRPGFVFSRSELISAVDPTGKRINDERSIDGYVKRIRSIFARVDRVFDQIETVHGFGYRWRG